MGSRHDPGTEAGSADTGNSAPSTTFARIALAGNHDADGTITSSAYWNAMANEAGKYAPSTGAPGYAYSALTGSPDDGNNAIFTTFARNAL